MKRVAGLIAALLAGIALLGSPSQGQPPAADAALGQGLAALEAGRYADAERILSGIERGPHRTEARLALGRVLLETGRYQQAEQVARALGSDRVQGQAAAVLLGEALLARGRLEDAQRALEPVAGESAARPPSSVHRARVFLGRLQLRQGRTAEARSTLMRLIRAYNEHSIERQDGEGLAYVGMAAAMLGSAHDANDAFSEAARAAPRRVEIQLEWAELFLSKYDAGHAEECVREALQVCADCARAHALMARIRLEQSHDFAAAQSALDRALAINPNLVAAHTTRAAIALRDMDLPGADRHIDAALAIDPNDLEALSVRAAIRFLGEDPAAFEAAVSAVLDRNPRYSALFSIIADHADWEHRYPDIVTLAERALRIDGADARAHATLGINLLRMGREQEGLEALRQAWRRDRFNVRVFNTLNLWDDVITPQYESFEARPFMFRMHREERPILEGLATTTLRAAYDDMRRRYRFTPRGPVWIELYASNQHFSVRTAGLPNVGVQGVCFGQVVTALSPRGGPFDWGQITTHELAHVFHIQLSRNRVPRWFTEGLAEHETTIARPEWRREEDHRLYRALIGDRIPPLRDLNSAFTHARSGEDLMAAYYAGSRVVGYIADRFGFDRTVGMLRGWGEGHATPDVVQRALGVSIDDLDRDWRAHELSRLASRASDFAVDVGAYGDLDAVRARAQAAAGDAARQGELAVALMGNGDVAGAAAAAGAAIALDAHQPLARFVLGSLAVDRRDGIEAETHVRDLITSGHDGYDVRLLEARAALARQDRGAAITALEAAAAIDDDRPEAWAGLVEMAGATGDAALRLRALRRLVAIEQHDRQSLADLMEELHRAQAWDELLTIAPRVVFVDPHNARGRQIHGEVLLQAGRAREALAELDAALLARPEHPGPVHLARARALIALRRGREARAAADEAARADPALADPAAALFR